MGAYFLIYVDCKITKSIYFFTCCLMEVFKGSVSDPSLTVPTVYFHVVQTLRYTNTHIKLFFQFCEQKNINLVLCTSYSTSFYIYRLFGLILSVNILQQTFANTVDSFLTSTYFTVQEIFPVGKRVLTFIVNSTLLCFSFCWSGLQFYNTVRVFC